MTRVYAFFLAVGSVLNTSCTSDPVRSIRAPQGAWTPKKIRSDAVTCTFPWVMEIDYRDREISYTKPMIQSRPWVTTFAGLETNAPKVIEVTNQITREIQGYQAFKGEHKITLVKVEPILMNTFSYSLDRETGIAMYTEHRYAVFSFQ